MRFLLDLRQRLQAAVPGVAFIFSLGLFGAAALWRQADIRAEANFRIKNINGWLALEVEGLLQHPIYGLNGARGLFAANHGVNRAEFKAYVDSHDLSQEFPGVRGFGYASRVLRSELGAFVAATRADGAPNFRVRQLADRSHDDMYIVKYIEPAKNNPRALGLDIASGPLRWATVQRAVNSGKPSMSAPITLIQTKQQTPGVLLMVPVYANGSQPADLSERRRASIGVLVAPVVLEELFNNLQKSIDDLMHIKIFDNKVENSRNRLIFDSFKQTDKPASRPRSKERPLYISAQRLSVFGRELTVQISSLPKFESSIDIYSPWIIFGGGAMASAALALYLRHRLREYNVVTKLVDQRTLALNRESLRLSTILAMASDGIFMLDAGGLLVEANPAFLNMLRLDTSAIGQLQLSNWNSPQGAIAIRAMIEELIDTGISSLIEIKIKRGDGGSIDAEVTASSISIDGKQLVNCSARDITERKLNEAKLYENEQRLRSLYELSPLGIVLANMQGELLEYNEAFRSISGYSAAELKSLLFWDLIPEPWRAKAMAQLEGLQLTQHIGPDEKQLLRNDGSLISISQSSMKIVSNNGQDQLWFIVEDISERKLAEKLITTANESAERDRHRLLLATRAGGVGVWDWDIVNSNMGWDESMYALYGISVDQFKGVNDAWQNGLHPDDRVKVNKEVEEALESGELESEFRVIWPDGSIHHILAHGNLIRDSDGKPLRMIGTNWDISKQKISEAKIEELAYFDQLTSLPNRRLFVDRFQRALVLSKRSKQFGAILYIDLDNFKAVNDIRGHDIGDMVLQGAAQNLGDCIRAGDTLTRIGGDEFIVLLEDLGDSSSDAARAAEIVAEKILTSFYPGRIVPTHNWNGTVSIGITLFLGSQENGIEEIIKQSDLALYQAKAEGRNRLQFYDNEMQEAIHAKSSMEQVLYEALENSWYELYYQAQFDCNKRLVSAEALLRLKHPSHGLISPSDFIPLAESSDLIYRIGDYILTAACAQLALWADRPATAELSLAINVSVKQFQQANFVDKIIAVVDKSGANPKLLTLEITENIFLGNASEVAAKMQYLKNYGINFSIDDFGTGYSSLSYLKSLPFDCLKIDKSFISDIFQSDASQGIVRSAISMGINLGLEVIAEGVETEEQFNFLIESGCEYFQGYLFSRPLPLAEFTALLTSAQQ